MRLTDVERTPDGIDGLDRLLTMSATNGADGSSVTYTFHYDEPPYAGRLTSVVEPDRTVRYGYDAAGRLTSETIQENGVPVALETQYFYDADGALGGFLYPSGLRLQMVRDPATREVLQVIDVSTGRLHADQVTHWPGGPASSLVFGNGLALSQTFNRRYEPLQVQSGPLSLAYAPTPAGDIAVVTDQSLDPSGCVQSASRSLGYDFLDRLSSFAEVVQSGTGICTPESLASLAGGLTYVSGNDWIATQRTPDQNGRAVFAFGYDYWGNVSAVGQYDAAGTSVANTMCLRHDALGRVVLAGSKSPPSFTAGGNACVRDSDVSTVVRRFKYDARNRRVARQEGSQWTYVVSDGAGNPLSELALANGAWSKVRDYVWLDGRLLAQIEYAGSSAYTYYAHLDHLGTPRALTNASGQLVWSTYQLPYGEVREKTATDPLSGRTVVTNLRLPGQYDERLFQQAGIDMQGPYYNWNRWYLPSLGRYMELDPPALQGLLDVRGKVLGPAPDWYPYARGNPLRFTDPMGLYGTKCCSFYERRCAQDPSSTYFCTLAKSVCNRRPKGEPWNDCVRKCLQDMDRAKRHDSDKDPVCKPLPYSAGDFTADHALCFAQCNVDKNSNPFNDTSEPNDDNCEH